MTSALISEFENYLAMQGKSVNTVNNYSRTMKRFFESGFVSPVDWIHAEKIGGASPAKLKGIRAASVTWLAFQGGSGDLDALRVYKLPAARPASPHPVPGGIDAVRVMIKESPSTQVKLMLALGAMAGLRISETRSLNDASWDEGHQVLSIYGKGAKTRNVPVSDELGQILDQSEWVRKGFVRWIGFADRTARMLVTTSSKSSGITHADGTPISSHDLRATFATEVYAKSGNDILAVQRLLGHASVSTTQAYIGLLDNRVRAAVNF